MNKKKITNIAIITIVVLITLIPMFISDYTNGHDTKFHVATIISYTESIKSGYLIPKILPSITSFGYGTGLFYPPLAHLISSYINLIIDNPLLSIKITYFISLLLSGLTMYFLSKKISKSDSIGLVSSVIYMLYSYHICNIYIRDALSEAMLFSFLPLIINGLYELFVMDDKNKFFKLFIAGYSLSILSHTVLSLYFTLIIIVFLIINYKKTFKNIIPILTSSFFILLITLFYWLPLLEQRIMGSYRVFKDGVMVQGTWGNGLSIFTYFNLLVNLKDNSVKYYIDVLTLIMLVVSLINFKKYNTKFYKYILIFGIISMILSSKLFPWDIFPKCFRIMQFPWRFVTFVSISVSLISPLCMNLFKDQKVMSYVICGILVLLSQALLHSFSNEVIDIDNLDFKSGEGFQHEYFPNKLYDNYDHYENKSIDDIEIISDSTPKLEFKVNTNSVTAIELPRIYYYGYTLKDENGKKYKLSESEYGFIEANLSSGIYTLDYTESNLYVIISLISVLVYGVIVCKKK